MAKKHLIWSSEFEVEDFDDCVLLKLHPLTVIIQQSDKVNKIDLFFIIVLLSKSKLLFIKVLIL